MFYPYLKEYCRPSIGYSLVIKNPMINNLRLISQLINGSRQMGVFLTHKRRPHQQVPAAEDHHRAGDITRSSSPSSTWKRWRSSATRPCPGVRKNSEFNSPLLLFTFAAECGLSFELDRLCRKKAFDTVRRLKTDKKIFVNTLTMTIHDPEFRGVYLERTAQRPQNQAGKRHLRGERETGHRQLRHVPRRAQGLQRHRHRPCQRRHRHRPLGSGTDHGTQTRLHEDRPLLCQGHPPELHQAGDRQSHGPAGKEHQFHRHRRGGRDPGRNSKCSRNSNVPYGQGVLFCQTGGPAVQKDQSCRSNYQPDKRRAFVSLLQPRQAPAC